VLQADALHLRWNSLCSMPSCTPNDDAGGCSRATQQCFTRQYQILLGDGICKQSMQLLCRYPFLR
jgi:hypothetical protein